LLLRVLLCPQLHWALALPRINLFSADAFQRSAPISYKKPDMGKACYYALWSHYVKGWGMACEPALLTWKEDSALIEELSQIGVLIVVPWSA
jgi:hypothetical protein